MHCDLCHQEKLAKELSISINFDGFHCSNSLNICADCEGEVMDVITKTVLRFDPFIKREIVKN